MKISVVVTILNEEKNIRALLDALVNQSRQPDEIIIVDGGSSDTGVSKISNLKLKIKNINIRFFVKSGNRSVGRNYGVSKAKYDWIAFTDAGCVPDRNWLEQLTKRIKTNGKQMDANVQVVAGYYYGLVKTNFQQAVVPYVLVMPDRVKENNFLPSTRSMIIKKSLFESVSGFDEKLSDNEDYEFAKRMQNAKCKITFTKKARVSWMPSENLFEFSKMIFRFAQGDAFAGIVRPKVVLIFIRYLTFITLTIFLFANKYQISNIRYRIVDIEYWVLIIGYLVWTILKNKKYVKHGWYYLPLLQISSDLAVMSGSMLGAIQNLKLKIKDIY